MFGRVETYAYDDCGNRTSRTSKATGDVETYTYDSQNRLIGYTDGTTTASYAYDALGRRIAKVVDGTTEAFVFDTWSARSVTNDIALDFADGTLTRRWQHGVRIDEPLAVEAYGADTTPGAGAVSELYADRLGPITEMVDATTGTVTASATYDSFGARTPTGQPPRYGFTGREHDAESGLIHFRARAYDPGTGQFLQRDPIGFAAGDLNLYAYVWNDPYNWTDPSGLSSAAANAGNDAQGIKDALKATGTIGGAALNIATRIAGALRAIDLITMMADGSSDESAGDAGDEDGAGASGGGEDPNDQKKSPEEKANEVAD